jgi:exopolysaccharide biosynthesis polyprenyl glycosylphosphotransferase
MNDAKRRVLLSGLKLFDLSMLVVSFALATAASVYVRQGPSLTQYLSMRIKLANIVMFVGTAVAWHVVFLFCGMYGSKRLSTRRAEIKDAIKATTLCAAGLAVAATIFSISMVTPEFLIFFWIFSSALVCAGRMLLRQFLWAIRRRGHNLRYTLILGTNPRALKFAQDIESRPELGYRILGFVDEDWPEMERFKQTGRAIVCDLDALPEYLRHIVVDEIANYLPFPSFYGRSSRIAAMCEQHGIIMRFDRDIFGLNSGRVRIDEYEGNYFIATKANRQDWGSLIVKRALDIALSSFLLVLLAPLFGVLAILIRLSSKGPVFFVQPRVGLNKRRFSIYKFRTMIPHAEDMLSALENRNEVSGPVFKIKKDPRLTPIGSILRRTSIDELPQLFNVLTGDMSLVGPRPLPFRDYEGFNEDWQRRRFSIRPGITCLWQVNGRSSIPFEEWMKLDLQYVDEWSLLLDLKILAQTIPAVLRGSGAA